MLCKQGIIVGSITGTCCFYNASGASLCWIEPLICVESYLFILFLTLECLNWSYDGAGKHLKLDAKIHIQGRRKSSANKITGIQVQSALAILNSYSCHDMIC